MFGLKKKKPSVMNTVDLDDDIDHILISFKKEMTEFVPDIETREDADAYVREHAADILNRISNASLLYSREVIQLKQRLGELKSDTGITSDVKEYIAKLELNIRLLEESYVQVFQIVNPASPRSMIHYYTQSEIANLCNQKMPTVYVKNHIPIGLHARLSDEYIYQYLPDADIVNKCMATPPKTTPEKVLQVVCVGDCVGSLYDKVHIDAAAADDLFNKSKTHGFTDNAILSLTVYDVCKSIKAISSVSVKPDGIVPQTYDMFEAALQNCVRLFPGCGYEQEMCLWAAGNYNCELFTNDGTVRACIIGSFFNNIQDVIRYAIVSAYATHSHKTGEQGAVFAAVCIWMALHGAVKHEIRDYVMLKSDDIICLPEELDGCPEKIFDLLLSPDDINNLAEDRARTYTKSGVRTLSQALICFLNASNIKDCIANSVKFPCNTASVNALGCGIAAAYFANLNDEIPYVDQILKTRHDSNIAYSDAFVMKRLAEL